MNSENRKPIYVTQPFFTENLLPLRILMSFKLISISLENRLMCITQNRLEAL